MLCSETLSPRRKKRKNLEEQGGGERGVEGEKISGKSWIIPKTKVGLFGVGESFSHVQSCSSPGPGAVPSPLAIRVWRIGHSVT